MPIVLESPSSSSGSPWLWTAFGGLIIVVLALDLGVFHRKAHRVGTREAAAWVTVWVTLALLFNAGLFLLKDTKTGVEFFTGYIVELSLSVDNIFVFVLLFSYFGIPPQHQYRVLFWGILGAVVMRLVFIFTAVELLERFDFLFYLFGLFLVYTGVKFLLKSEEIHPEKNLVLRLARRYLPLTSELHGERFLIREEAPGTEGEPPDSEAGTRERPRKRRRLVATPLLLTLLAVEATDVIFAVDSVPAILGITRDRFVAYTSNIFAILGLRAMYFLLVSFLDRFHLLRIGLSLVLIFIGAKMLLHRWIHVPAEYSLIVVVLLLGGSVALSLLVPAAGPRKEPPGGPAEGPPGA